VAAVFLELKGGFGYHYSDFILIPFNPKSVFAGQVEGLLSSGGRSLATLMMRVPY
jgi:hypothetical protein